MPTPKSLMAGASLIPAYPGSSRLIPIAASGTRSSTESSAPRVSP